MAEAKTTEKDYKLNQMEQLWIKQSLAFQRAGLIRKRGTEQPGSAIHDLRGKEISEVDMLIQKFA